MKTEYTQQQLKKLPKWARQEIEDLKRERLSAIHALNEFVDHQTESPFSIEKLVITGEESGPSFKTLYIQGHYLKCKFAGIDMEIRLDDKRNCIKIQYCSDSASGGNDIALVPQAFQSFKIVTKENMHSACPL